MDLNDLQRKEWRKIMLIAFAMLVAAPIVYLIVSQIIGKNINQFEDAGLLFYILLIIAIISPGAPFIIERIQLNNYRDNRQSQMSPAQLFTSLAIMKFAFVEAIYIYGFMIFVMTGETNRMLLFYPIGTIWSFVHWPRKMKFVQFIEREKRP